MTAIDRYLQDVSVCLQKKIDRDFGRVTSANQQNENSPSKIWAGLNSQVGFYSPVGFYCWGCEHYFDYNVDLQRFDHDAGKCLQKRIDRDEEWAYGKKQNDGKQDKVSNSKDSDRKETVDSSPKGCLQRIWQKLRSCYALGIS
jgi:hypothetical protein